MTSTSILDMSPCLLAYRFPTQPQPIQVSTPSGQTDARINVVVLNDGKTYCKEIDIYVPVGKEATDLTENDPTVAPNTSKWSVGKGVRITGDKIGLPKELTFVQFNCTCNSPADYLINYVLAFSIFVQPVNQTSGTFTIGIVETSDTSSSPTTQRSNQYTLSKASPQFYVKNFIASKQGSAKDPNKPCGEFANKEAIVLSWEGNATNYQLITTPSQQPVYSGSDTSFVLTKGLTQTTTFILVATVTGGPGSGTPEPGFETVYLYEALTVHITNPDITPKSVTASGKIISGKEGTDGGLEINSASRIILSLAASGGGCLQIANNSNDDTIFLEGFSGDEKGSAAGMYLTGKNSENIPHLGLKANTTEATGALNVKGDTTLTKTSVGTLGVSGATELKDTTVSGTLAATGAVNMMGNAQKVDAGTYTAKTDGFVIGYVGSPSDAKEKSLAWITGSTSDLLVQATGGNNLYYFDGNKTYGCSNMPNSFMMPVKKDNHWTVGVQYGAGKPEVKFSWIPLGSDNTASIERLPDDSPEAKAAELVSSPSVKDLQIPCTFEADITNLVEVITDISMYNLSDDQKCRLHDAFRRLGGDNIRD
jgi:hypothetical protein